MTGTATSDHVCRVYSYTSTDCNSVQGTFTPGSSTTDSNCICPNNKWLGKNKENTFVCYDIIPNLNTLKKCIDYDFRNSSTRTGMVETKVDGKNYGLMKTWKLGPEITDLSDILKNTRWDNLRIYFKRDISKWDVSNVTNMEGMFKDCTWFNSDISEWDVSNVTNMKFMFQSAKNFNRDISKWDVSKVTNMEGMFDFAWIFNQDINTKVVTREDGTEYTAWDVSNVTNMQFMFQSTKYFNGDISKWDVSKVTNMKSMFKNAYSFNQDISEWDMTMNHTNYNGMFKNATKMNKFENNYKKPKKIRK